jgi:hypothetical protein
LKEQGIAKMDEELIFQAYRKLHALEQQADVATRKARRPKSGKPPGIVPEPVPDASDVCSEEVRPFEEIEPWP